MKGLRSPRMFIKLYDWGSAGKVPSVKMMGDTGGINSLGKKKQKDHHGD
ncbi:hypothetical protein Tco_0713845, partial [Tanacetum coccineum]